MGGLKRLLSVSIPPNISRVSKVRVRFQVLVERSFVHELSTRYVHKYRVFLHRGKFVSTNYLVGELCQRKRDNDCVALRKDPRQSFVSLKRFDAFLSNRLSRERMDVHPEPRSEERRVGKECRFGW